MTDLQVEDLCDVCLHRKVCYLNLGAIELAKILLAHAEKTTEEFAYVTHGVIECKHHVKEDSNAE